MAINRAFVFPKFVACDITKIVPRASPQGIDLISKMLLWDPKYRPTARECLNHPYFNSMRQMSNEIEKAVDLNTVPSYIGPNHESEQLMKRNNTMIANAV